MVENELYLRNCLHPYLAWRRNDLDEDDWDLVKNKIKLLTHFLRLKGEAKIASPFCFLIKKR